MSMSKKVKLLLVKRNVSIKELSGLMDCKPTYLYNRFTRDSFSEKDFLNIATALNFVYEGSLTLRDTGERI